MRCPQRKGERGSLKWIQRAVNNHPQLLDSSILSQLPKANSIQWRSPLERDEYAEYRDAQFLELVEAENLSEELSSFWPRKGPQWDALALSDKGDVLLVEAKAHIGELCSPPAYARDGSLKQIEEALNETISFLDAEPRAPWTGCFYQLANRLAHLYFLRTRDVPAWLVLINFVNDTDMDSPGSEAEWKAAYQVVWHVLGLNRHHRLSRYVIELYPAVFEDGLK